MAGFAFGSTGEETFIKQSGMHIVAVLVLFGACRCLPGKGCKQADRGQEEDAEAVVPHLIELDLRSEKDPGFALEIARQARRIGDRPLAFKAAERAARMHAYDPATRELAASCSIEAGRLQDARRHIAALAVLEPQQPRHAKRLQAIDRLIESRKAIPAG